MVPEVCDQSKHPPHARAQLQGSQDCVPSWAQLSGALVPSPQLAACSLPVALVVQLCL